MADIATLGVKVTTSGVKEAERDLKGLSAEGAKAEKRAEALGNAWGKKLGIAVLAGAGVLAVGLRAVIKNTIEAEKAQAQLNAVLRSTQGVAGVTSEQVLKLSSALQTITVFGDEAITGVQSLLLTFTKIGGDVFPEATKATLNIAQALGQDLKTSAVQVGKALNDPVRGITALQRVGITFSDEQRKLIESLVDTGQAAEAQRVILAELETQFGGSAEAARNTLGGAIEGLKNAFGDLLEGDTGGDGVRGTTDAINQLTATLSSEETRRSFQVVVEGLLDISNAAAQTIGLLTTVGGFIGDAFKAPEELDREGLIDRQLNLEERIANARKRGPVVTGFLPSNRENVAELEAELRKVIELTDQLTKKEQASTIAGQQKAQAQQAQGAAAKAFSQSGRELIEKLEEEAAAYGLSKSALLERQKAQAVANAATDEEKAQLTGAYDALILKVRADESARGASKGAAAAAREAAQAERERQLVIREGQNALQGLSEQVRQNAADLAGPAAQAAKQYADELTSLVIAEEKLRAANLLTADTENQLAIARDQAAESYKRRLEAIEAQLSPAEQLIADLEFELELMGLGNLAREKEIALRYAGADATDEQRARIEQLIEAQDRAAAAAQGLDVLRQSTEGLFKDLMDGSKSAKEAFSDFVDSILAGIARIVAQKLTESLFGSMGQSGGGLFGGSSDSGLGGLFASFFSGGRAIGGPVSGSNLYEVGEKGQPELLDVKGRKYLIPGADGMVTPMGEGRGASGLVVNQVLNVTGAVTPKSAYQIQREASLELNKATSR